MQQRRIGSLSASALGMGCMNLSQVYGTPPSPEAAGGLLLRALDRGITLFDTAALYGFGTNETLLGRVLKPHRSQIVLASKRRERRQRRRHAESRHRRATGHTHQPEDGNGAAL